jgi:photosystem II stability/assembly factor-like uncharacterized protein
MAWALATLVIAVTPQDASAAAVPESAYGDLRWRLVGPFRAGWATVTAGVPGDPRIFYLGAADGGVWRTRDAGVTWQPLFDRQGSASIGALALAPSDPRVIWVGTGQIHQRWDIVSGDGVYRSTDGGGTWAHVGLADTRHIGAIWVDPRNADIAIVAALGHVFGPNDERGLLRTEDAGRSWSSVLYRDADTGAADVTGDPAFPDVLYASLWQVRRHPWLDYFQPPIGPGSGIYKSNDGGRSWSAVAGDGLPQRPLGRIELAVAPATQARRVWAAIDAPEVGGLYRTDDGGSSWTRVNTDASLGSSYTCGITPDPRDRDVVWVVGRGLRRSTDGGASFAYVRSSPGGDDYHFLWIDPTDRDRMITGSDQGAVLTLNGGRTWSSWYNQPTGQFYRLAADDRFPYWIYGGQQDSGTMAIASRSDYGQITFRDWHPVGGEERDGDVPDPVDPDVVYGAGLGGQLSKWNARTGQTQDVSPWPVSSYAARPGTARYRYDWITPLAISKRPSHAIYLGAQVLFRSLDGGQSWQTVSPDLTGAVEGARRCEGDVAVERATACGWGTIFAISPSAAADGLVWVGTDNGRVQVTRDDGVSWTNVTPPDLADWTKVNTIDPSQSDPATAYVAADRHRLDDARPLAWRTHDCGKTWAEIGHGLPGGGWVGVVRQDPQRAGLLFAGTSRGVHVSFDDGDHWQSLQLNLPTTGINDLLVHHGDLIAATQGRAIWVLDAIEPLRHFAAEELGAGILLVPPPIAYRLRPNQNRDTPLPPEEPRGENPPVGAIIDYVLGSAGAPAAGAAGEARSAGGAVGAASAETAPPVVLEIVDSGGRLVRRISSNEKPARAKAEVYFADLWLGDPPSLRAGAGHHRFVWDLRYPEPPTLRSEYSIAAVPGRPTPTLPQGAFVLPGRYELRLTVGSRTVSRTLDVAMDPRATVSTDDLSALLAFQTELGETLARAVPLAQSQDSLRERLSALTADPRAKGLRRSIESARTALDAARGPNGETPATIAGDLTSLATQLERADVAPTAPQRSLLADAQGRLGRAQARWREFERRRLATLEHQLQSAGIQLREPKP